MGRWCDAGQDHRDLVAGFDHRHVHLFATDLAVRPVDHHGEDQIGRVGAVPQITDEDHLLIHLKADRGELGGDLGHRRAWVSVWGGQAIDDERRVVEDLAEVAAVAEVRLAVDGGAQAVVAPLPDQAADHARQGVEQVLVASYAAGSVAHGVHELAKHDRTIGLPGRLAGDVGESGAQAVAQVFQALQRGVHAAQDVGVAAGVIALVVHRTSGVAAVGPRGHGGQVGPGAGFVAE